MGETEPETWMSPSVRLASTSSEREAKMAERVVLVCDVDGKEPATKTVRIQVGGRNFNKDLCQKHLDALLQGARSPRRGRKATTRTRTTRPRATAPKSATRRTRRAASPGAVATEAKKLRDSGLSYRQIGDALIKRGMKPQRAKAWNPVVLGRMLKRTEAQG